MGKYKISPAMRFFFLFSGSVIWLGIWLTGFSVAYWLLYVPACFFYFAALTGKGTTRFLNRRAEPVDCDELEMSNQLWILKSALYDRSASPTAIVISVDQQNPSINTTADPSNRRGLYIAGARTHGPVDWQCSSR